jgi:signal peptidase I
MDPNQLPTSPLPPDQNSQPGPQPHPLDNPARPSQPVTQRAVTPQPAAPAEESESGLAQLARGFTGILSGIFSWIIFPVAVVLILHNFVFQAYHVLGTSMVPTLHDTDYLIISKVGYTQALLERSLGRNDPYLPARGQIIVFHYPKDPTKIFVKRVIGEPGDHVVIRNGTVTVFNSAHPNGLSPDTSYEPADSQTLIDTDVTVQPDSLFVMGDNRTPGGSYDSREWGQLPSSYIIGNAVLRLLPLDQVKIL